MHDNFILESCPGYVVPDTNRNILVKVNCQSETRREPDKKIHLHGTGPEPDTLQPECDSKPKYSTRTPPEDFLLTS